jgi:hypothetical protein
MSRRVHLVLEFEDSEPISGSLHLEDGASRLFSGWLGLIAAIKETADGELSPTPADGGPTASDGGVRR